MTIPVHPAAGTPEYVAWRKMITRCVDPYNRRWPEYGGAGIKVFEPWKHFDTFRLDMGPRPAGHVLARRTQSGDYTPENCFWERRRDSPRRHCVRLSVTYDGQTLGLAEWARRTGVPLRTLRNRLLVYGWPPGQALGIEPRPQQRPKLSTPARSSSLGA